MSTIGVGLIGLGRHGMRYAKHILEEIPQARLVAVCRRNAKEGRQFAQRHQLRYYQDFRDLIADQEVAAILVVTAPSLTLPIAQEAIRHRKPLLIEKPLAIHMGEAREIVETAACQHIPLMTAQTLRYDATVLKLKELGPQLGTWKSLSLTARMEQRDHSQEEIQAWNGRGTILEIGVHLLDLARFLTTEEIQDVYCEIERPARDAPENLAWIRLTTQTGLRCLLDVSRVSGTRVTRAEIVGEKGQACANWTTSKVQISTDQRKQEEFLLPRTQTLRSVLQDFCHALEHHTPMPITGLDGQRAIELAEACYESAACGKPVRLL